jgi:hypothetical protein
MTRKLNCWEFRGCGREPEGKNTSEMGMCPAATKTAFHGIHEGMNGGRACWVVAGTMCDGNVVGTFAGKYEDCRACEFYEVVKKEEGEDFLLTIDVLRMVMEKK